MYAITKLPCRSVWVRSGFRKERLLRPGRACRDGLLTLYLNTFQPQQNPAEEAVEITSNIDVTIKSHEDSGLAEAALSPYLQQPVQGHRHSECCNTTET